MASLKISVIIPTYRGADLVGTAIQSVLKQTYSDFEVVVVNDASPDDTEAVISQFDDSRLAYIAHAQNRGARAARETGIGHSTGKYVAFLDQDDLFHPEKLEAHVAFLEKHPDIDATYNSRFELNYSAETVRDIWRPPQQLSLADFVMGFPIAPSDLMLRREWAIRMLKLQEGENLFHGGEIISYGRLFMAGCRFGFVDRALNYRRHHSGRLIRDIAGNCQAYLYAQEKIFSDPACPPEVVALRSRASGNSYAVWACYALNQEETTLGPQFLREAVKNWPLMIEGVPAELVKRLVAFSIRDDNLDHEVLLIKMFNQLPFELQHLSSQLEWAIAQGYLLRGVRAFIWDRPDIGRHYLETAIDRGASQQSLVREYTHRLVNYEREFGPQASDNVLKCFESFLKEMVGGHICRRIRADFYLTKAFDSYQLEHFERVPLEAVQALVNNPTLLKNRGLASILVRSFVKQNLFRIRCPSR